MTGKCKNCGGWESLHHYETMQCPRNGTENNDWQHTRYQEEDTSYFDMMGRIAKLEEQVASLLAAVPQADKPEWTPEEILKKEG